MGKINSVLVVIILATLFACTPKGTFTEPQPTDTENLLKFTKNLQGRYLSLTDSSILFIEDEIIQRIYDFTSKIHLNELDSTLQISSDTLIDIKSKEKYLITYDRDSLVVHIHFTDTLFQIDDDNVVRKFEGYYFLNIRYSENCWGVQKMQLTKRQLLVSNISTEIDIPNLQEITAMPQDTVCNFTVTKKQFRMFLKNGGFSDCEVFIKL